jgi:hypothetical protein
MVESKTTEQIFISFQSPYKEKGKRWVSLESHEAEIKKLNEKNAELRLEIDCRDDNIAYRKSRDVKLRKLLEETQTALLDVLGKTKYDTIEIEKASNYLVKALELVS